MKRPVRLFYFGGPNFFVEHGCPIRINMPALSVILPNRLHSILKESKTSTSIIPWQMLNIRDVIAYDIKALYSDFYFDITTFQIIRI